MRLPPLCSAPYQGESLHVRVQNCRPISKLANRTKPMITALDAQPQEWMEGKENTLHTVAACHFKSLEHLEHWVHRLAPRNQNGEFVKWSGGRRKAETRDRFIENCFKYAGEIDFQVNCVSTSEGEMGWFA